MQDNKRLTHNEELQSDVVEQTERNQTAEPTHRTTSGSEAVLCGGEVEQAVADAQN